MTTLDQYQHKYRNMKFERRDGVLQISLHTDGDSMRWGADPGCIHEQLGLAFSDVARDRDNKVVLLTGTGSAYCKDRNIEEYNEPYGPDYWYRISREAREMLMNLLEIDVPVISAINGPALIHSELPVLADVVIASDTVQFRDTHMAMGAVPGDGCHSVWNLLLGPSRGHYYLLMAETLSVQDAHRFGVVHEILPVEKLMPRAWEIAMRLAAKPIQSLRYSRLLFTQPIKEAFQKDLAFGLALLGLSVGAMSGTAAASKLPTAK